MKTQLHLTPAGTAQTSKKLSALPLLILLLLMITGFNSKSQVLIDPAGDGGFELGSTFAANGWTAVNAGAAAANKWYVGNVVTTAGGRGVYVDKNGGTTTNQYDVNTARVQYFYKDVTFPAGVTNINLSFKWKCIGETGTGADDYDFLRVYLVSTATTPTAGTLLPAGNIIGTGKYNNQGTTQSANIVLPNSLANTTQRLVFCWRNDGSVGNQPPASVDEISLSCTPSVPPAITGFTPAAGCANTTSITITGTNLGSATAVTIGGTAVSSITSNTATQIVAVIGAGTTGTVTVTTAGGPGTSASTFTVNSLPAIYNVTGGGTYCSGGSGVNIGLSNSQTGINYQLYRGAATVGSPLAGTGSSLDFGLFTTAGTYTVIATNATTGCVKNQSGSAIVSINTPASISTDPVSAVRCAGTSVTFSVTASGSSPGYQWRKNGVNIASAISSTYTIPAVAAADAAGYDVVVTVTTCGSVTSAVATLTVNPLPSVYAVTGGGSYCSGGAGLPVGLSGSETGVNYTLSPGAIVVAGTGAAISFGNQTAAATYTVAAQNATTGCPKAMSGNAVITINNLPTISTQPIDKTACTGTPVSFTLTATGAGLTYQWKKGSVDIINGGTISGAATATLTISSVAMGDAATDYNCVVTNTCGSLVSDYVSLIVNMAAIAPVAQPTALIFPTVGITSIVGSFTASSTATNYLVVRRTTATAPANPVNGTSYAIGSAALGAGTYVEYNGTGNVFTSNGLNPGTTYYYTVYAFNTSTCGTSPLYFTSGPLTGNATTATNVNCGTVTPFYWAGTGSAFTRSGKTSDFNTPANWSLTTPSYTASPVSPTECNDVIITPNSDVIITLSANAAVYNMTFTVSGGSDVVLSVQGKTLEINGNALIDITGGASLIQIGENSAAAGIVDFKANVKIGVNAAGVFSFRESDFIGNASSKIIFRGDLTLGRTCGIPSAQTPGTVLFDGDGLQQILWNNDLYFANFSNVILGSANNPTVRHVTGTYTPDNILNSLTINGSSTLDLATSQWIRDNAGGSFSLNGTSKMILSNNKSIVSPASSRGVVIPGSNFPGGFSSVTISPNSTVEYNGDNTITQTVYAAPTYGFLTLTNCLGSGIANKISTGAITVSNKFIINSGVTMTPAAGITANNDFFVKNAAVLQCGTNIVSGAGAFILQSGGTLGMASPQGISQSGATGNIRTSNRIFSTGANYIYNGTGALITGNGLPTLMNDLTIANTSGITLFAAAANYTVGGTLRLTAGPFILNGNTLTISSLIRSSGTFSGSATSGIIVKGTNMPLYFTSGAAVLKVLTLNNSATANLATALDITAGSAAGAVSVGINSVLTTNNNLTLKSDASGTARIAEIPVNGSGVAQGAITGNVTVERYISGQRAWRFLAIPTAGSQTIHDSWQEGQAQGNNTLAGKGIQISGATFPSNGFDSYTAAPVMKTWSGTAYVGISGTNIPVATDNGYMTFIRGDRTINYFTTATPPPTVLRTSGTLKTGKYPSSAINLSTGVFTAVGNPYASAIDFNKVTRGGGTPNTFYVWDPKLTTGPSSTYGLGGFRTITWDNVAGAYIVTPAGGSYSSGNTNIESGAAFFVLAPLSAGTLSFPESAKETTSNLVERPAARATGSQLRTNMYVIAAGVPVLIDGALVQYNESYSPAVDELDALKLMNSGENIGIKRNDKIFAVERRANISASDTIFYNLGQIRQQQYKLEFTADNLAAPGLDAFLEDNYLHTRTAISLTDTANVLFSITATDAASYASDRFRMVFSRPQGPLPVTITQISANRTSDKAIAVNWKVENEINMENYEVEQSADGRNFNKINTTAPKFNTTGAGSYNHMDEKALSADNFYRIKAISIGGKVQYSAVVKVAAQKTSSTSIAVYPNPVIDKKMAVAFYNQAKGMYKLELSNQLGQVMFTTSLQVDGNNVVKTVSLDESVTAGKYQLTIVSETGTKNVQQLIIL